MAVDLLTPVPSDRTRSINFFNGRLLTGEDLTTEQKTNRVAHGLLGQAIGDGVVYGLQVSESAQSSTPQSPVLAVTQGLAINKVGTSLLLDTDTEVALVRPATATNGTAAIFQDCTPTQVGPYIAGAGVYLLTIGPATAPQGLAEVSGVSTAKAPCNSKYNVQGVQFRLIPIDLTQAELTDTNHLRNLVAYKCFGVADFSSFASDPFGTPLTSYGLLDQLRSNQVVTDCDVPLAVLYWTATLGLVFVDMWAVRRPVFPQAATETWAPLAGRRRMAEGLAMFLQFQAQVNDMVEFGVGGGPLTSVVVMDYFRYLPAAGLLPLVGAGSLGGFDYAQFFSNRTYRAPVFIEGAKLEQLICSSLLFPPVDLKSGEMIWLYWIRENIQAINRSIFNQPQPYMTFTNGQVPFEGEPRYDLNYWNYANYV
jgi:hypothetical protein